MAEYRINSSGQLVIEDEDGDVTITPASDFPLILALIAPPATAKPEANRVTFTIGGGRDRNELQWHCGGESGLLFYAGNEYLERGDVLPDEYDDYDELAAYIFKHQPDIDLATVKAWGRYDTAARNAYTYLKAQSTPPEAKPGPWYMDDEYLRYRGRGRYVLDTDIVSGSTEIAAWAVANQPEVSGDDLDFLTDGEVGNRKCAERLREIRARLEAPAEASSPPAEVAKGCDCASVAPNDSVPAPESPRQRNVIITITFDPADTECAESIYRAVNSISYPYRLDCVRTRVE